MKRAIAVALVVGLVGTIGCDSKKTDGKTDVKQPDGKVAEPAQPDEELHPPPVT